MESGLKQRDVEDDRSLADEALDTLGCVFQTFGNQSFPLDTDNDPDEFRNLCADVVRHIENGSPVPNLAIEPAVGGQRSWGPVRRFYVERRQSEKDFVTHRMKDYRGVVEDLVLGLREICAQGNSTEETITMSLKSVEDVVAGGELPDIKRALADTISTVGEAFVRQRREYEQQIEGLQDRMSGLRQDLVAAHEEMKLDPLTDIYNRRAFDTSIERCLNVHFMLKQPISMVMIDVDNFKSINDSYGHAKGDEVLRTIAECLSRAFIRKNDLITRFGGDEFAVILPDTSLKKSKVSINRFLQSVRVAEIADFPDEVRISCSAGCTEIVDGDTFETLIGRADEALYEAKQAGRNCLVTR